MIKTHFNNQLKKLGYPEGLTIEYSLSYCQGDGMSFYGNLDEDDLEKLMLRIYDPNTAGENAVLRVKNLLVRKEALSMLEILREADIGCCRMSIERNSHGHRYSHYNCMDLCHEVDFESFSEEHFEAIRAAGLVTGEVTDEHITRWQSIWNDFVSRLEHDIKSTSQQLEAEGYALVEGTPYEEVVSWEFNTADYTVQLKEHPEHDFDIGCWDEELALQTIQDIVDGKQRYLRLEAKILDRETEEELASESIGGLVIDVNDRSYGSYRRELVSNAIAEVRKIQLNNAISEHHQMQESLVSKAA
ncbi:NgrC [Vibrio parahaemolyticus]